MLLLFRHRSIITITIDIAGMVYNTICKKCLGRRIFPSFLDTFQSTYLDSDFKMKPKNHSASAQGHALHFGLILSFFVPGLQNTENLLNATVSSNCICAVRYIPICATSVIRKPTTNNAMHA